MIEVTQADREAAAKWAKMQGRPQQAANMRRGSCDSAPLVQAFARHRLAGVKAGMDAAARALEADAQLCDCFARSEGECACGAWSDYKTVPMERAVEIVRAIDPTTVGAEHDAA